jgi:uncharacterized protein (DUF1919 family)
MDFGTEGIINDIKYFIRDNTINRRDRKRLKNKSFSIISCDCLGGMKLHDLRLRFNTPTVNLWFMPGDFIKLCTNLRHYMEQELVFIDRREEGVDYPVARLDDITVYFMHYSSEEEAVLKWDERKKRINYEDLYFIMVNRKNNISYEQMREFDEKLQGFPHMIISLDKVNGIKSAFYCETDERRLLSLYKNKLSVRRFYDKFDFVGWFNKEISSLEQ